MVQPDAGPAASSVFREGPVVELPPLPTYHLATGTFFPLPTSLAARGPPAVRVMSFRDTEPPNSNLEASVAVAPLMAGSSDQTA